MESPKFQIEPPREQVVAPDEGPTAYERFWRPWYAKAWWISIPIYWTIAGGALHFRPPLDFYQSTIGVLVSFLFTPFATAFGLGFDYLASRFRLENCDPMPAEEFEESMRQMKEGFDRAIAESPNLIGIRGQDQEYRKSVFGR